MIFLRRGRWKPAVKLNIFYNYAVQILKPQNNESGEPEFKNFEEKSQDNNELIIHNTIINARQKQITDMIWGPPFFQES